ncbi:(deoxy)nucleoside triphosphate pyrophosphohydrolase [Blastococcus sp. LR1]|uniref:(deoxy)nucleoside triphosphate pyrophosphohydrolase n=1 Tax=Blastococcus sp. LR1 TaxID=2877000 RepID=UPI001CCB4C2E|nr:(deoxy)nucleoside triphosphate pyrophosphohydrolase [Blastococcus sp. LR1]MCA0144412.1 (deoxy)nucleoside triphosphate pyrophosphohydrolase [Blastococcus sp. LR1]
MPTLRFTTVVEAPLTVAFDVARALGRPWPFDLEEVGSVRPERDVASAMIGRRGRVTHSRRFSGTAAGTLVEEQLDWEPGSPGGFLRRRRIARAMHAHLDAFAAAAERRALDVVQVVGAAVVDAGRVLVAQRSGGVFDGRWEFPGGKVERGESELEALVRECQEELGVTVVPREFVGEVPLDGVVAGGAPGASTMRVWAARLPEGEPVAHEHSELRWVGPEELDAMDWIPADRPLLPAVRALLAEN